MMMPLAVMPCLSIIDVLSGASPSGESQGPVSVLYLSNVKDWLFRFRNTMVPESRQ